MSRADIYILWYRDVEDNHYFQVYSDEEQARDINGRLEDHKEIAGAIVLDKSIRPVNKPNDAIVEQLMDSVRGSIKQIREGN